MIALMNWRIWLLAALVGLIPLSYGKGRLDGRKILAAEHAAAQAAANAEARKLEQSRQRRADEAAQLAATREAGIRADADRARGAVGGLRGAVDAANRARDDSQATAAARAAAFGKLLVEGAEAHRELAERCDRHVSDLRMLLQAWPK